MSFFPSSEIKLLLFTFDAEINTVLHIFIPFSYVICIVYTKPNFFLLNCSELILCVLQDTVIYDRLAESSKYKEITLKHLEQFATEGG